LSKAGYNFKKFLDRCKNDILDGCFGVKKVGLSFCIKNIFFSLIFFVVKLN